MSDTGIICILLLVANFFVSYRGFTSPSFFRKYAFETAPVLERKEYIRLASAGFLHLGWMHLLFNLFSMYAFGGALELYLGPLRFLLIYFFSLLGGNVLALFIHRRRGNYTAVGASGAVCGLIFSCLVLFPRMGINIFGIFFLPGWLYAFLFFLITIAGIRSRSDGICHEAHLGGGLAGMFTTIVLEPASLRNNLALVIVLMALSLLLLYVLTFRPQHLLSRNIFRKEERYYSIDHRYNAERTAQQKEVDAILDKIHRKGMESLSRKEREVLDAYSKKVR